MKEVQSFLIDWCIRFLENKDAVKREIKEITDKSETGFCIEYQSGKKQFYVAGEFNKDLMDSFSDADFTGIFIVNNSSSVSFLIKNWKEISKNSKLMLYFFNPLSKSDKVWIINPYVHNMICDPESLETGIKAMAEMVQETTISEMEQNLE